MDISYRQHEGILRVEPAGSLSENDFEELAEALERLGDGDADLNGILIHTPEFPGYEEFGDLLAHVDFVREYGDRVPKVALCTDSPIGPLIESIGDLFADAEVERFGYDDQLEAEEWLLQ